MADNRVNAASTHGGDDLFLLDPEPDMPVIDWAPRATLTPLDTLAMPDRDTAYPVTLGLAQGHRDVARAAIDQLHEQHRTIERQREQITSLIDENRTLRQRLEDTVPDDNRTSTGLVPLRGGVSVPETALRLALDLQERGIVLTNEGTELVVRPRSALTAADERIIRDNVPALRAIVAYVDKVVM